MIKLNKCGCGGEPKLIVGWHRDNEPIQYCVYCKKCEIETADYNTEIEAAEAWNLAMGAKDTNVPDKERTAKVDWINGEPYCPMCGDRLEWE